MRGDGPALLLPEPGHGRPHRFLVLEAHDDEGLAGLDAQSQGLLENGPDRFEPAGQLSPLPLASVRGHQEMGASDFVPFLGLALNDGRWGQEKDGLKDERDADGQRGPSHDPRPG